MDEPDGTVEERFDELLPLEEGWYWGDGEAISREDGRVAQTLIEDLLSAGMIKPYIYPEPEQGGIKCEYSATTYSVDMEIDPDRSTVEILIMHRDNDHEIEDSAEFDLSNRSAIIDYLTPYLKRSEQ